MMSHWTVAPGTKAGEHAAAVLAERESRATALGAALGDFVGDPVQFAARLHESFAELADPEYRAGQAFVAPGIGPTHGVRTPLQVAVRRAFEKASRRASPAELLLVCDRLLREPEREARWFAISTLQRTLPAEPERTWQLLRRAATEADDWITTDDLAHPYGKGILAEPYRWAELEQLTVSPSRWERRLVGSTIATLPFRVRPGQREELRRAPALELLESLIGDAEADVQKAISWALRSWYRVDPEGVSAFIGREAQRAAADGDGHRAWVVRDALTLPGLPAQLVDDTRARLQGLRRNAAAPSTSRAYAAAQAFAGLPDAHSLAEAPLAR
jgi:3-methyladenine DNA glycosylase AlkD